ncbi:MAG: NUDIX domain-containing protein [Bacteroidales bacterium]|nr:NUDIX domain-containing protein [Bacteroidales bacterium]
MYKVFFNDRTIFLTDDFSKNFQVKYGLFYKYRSVEDLQELVSFYNRLKKINSLYIFHHDIEVLRNTFKSCFLNLDAAGGLIKNNKDEYLFIFRRGKWDLPKGKVDQGETIEEAAVREAQEECGIKDVNISAPMLSTYHTYEQEGKFILKKPVGLI